MVEAGARPAGDEGLLEGLRRRAQNAVGERELDIAQVVLVRRLAEHIIANRGSAHDLHVAEARPVARGHILEHLRHGTVDAHIAILTVHVVMART